jgi:FkbM family methyltransferase
LGSFDYDARGSLAVTFVSYAQNFEDVLLWRALRSIDGGFYIDVGAAHPDIDSVTRAFYDRGWSGINVEPTAEFSMRLAAARPRDINLQILLGEHPGRAKLFVVDGTGLSTVDPAAVDPIRKAGMEVRRAEVAVDTLANLCRDHAPASIHFLKVDVEGAERAVLAGADFRTFRPWIVLVEATAPMSAVMTHHAWEPILLSAEYRFVWFDGLNRFYVSAEKLDALAHAFQTPVNVFDDFLRVADSDLVRRIQEAEKHASDRVMEVIERAVKAEVRSDYEALGAAHARVLAEEASREAEQLRAQLEHESRRRMAAEAEATELTRRAEAAEADAAGQAMHAAAETQRALYEQQRSAINEQREREAIAAFDAIRRSTSWRITTPLRRLRSRRGAVGPVITQLPAPPQSKAPVVAHEEAPNSAMPDGLVSRQKRPLFPRTTVHQFHSGAATGDAITNSMLLTRQRLRELGYHSEIFVTFRDPALAHELRLIEDLPRHEHYILIVRHSMGFDAFDAVASIPAPKILLYHNITPPELLRGDAFMQSYAMLGREQLKQWRTLVCSSLADSEYNAIELRTLGFYPVQVCNTLINTDALLARAAATPKLKDPGQFTILFVGRVVRSKAQAELIDVFAAFRNRYRKPCRLVIVGRHGGPEDDYLVTIAARLKEYGIAEDVVLIGAVSDDELHSWYARADVYLSLSRHEGFGVPLIEAMAHDLPVLARPAAAVPYTLAGTGGLLTDETIDGIVDRLLDLARGEEHQVALVARQRAALERARWEHHELALLQALATAGAAPPVSADTQAVLSSSMQLTVTGHVNGSYSLAAINRALALALDIARPGRVRLAPVEGGPTTDLGRVPISELVEIEALVARPKPVTAPHVVISQHYPVYTPSERGDLTLAYFFWEESVVPQETIRVLNTNFDAILAPTVFVAKTLIDSGLSRSVRVIGFAPRLEAFHALATTHRVRGGRPFTFLHVSSGFPRKGIDALLLAYARAFRSADRVDLIIKVFPNPHNTVRLQVADWQAANRDAPAITLIDCDSTDEEILQLYRNVDAVVLPTRGEGFNIPAAEAMAAGLPLIVTGYGGHLDFCNSSVRLIDYSFAPSGSHLSASGSLWAEPDVDDLIRALSDAASHRSSRPRPARLPEAGSFAEGIIEAAAELLLLAPFPPLRIGWVSSWGVRCGIAEYSRHLLDAMLARDEDLEVTLLCDKRTDADAREALDATIRPCWDLFPPHGAEPLARAVAEVDPDVLVIQHQPGLITWEALAQLLGAASLKERPVVVVLHTTQRILDIAEDDRCAVIAALGGVARVMVHTINDVNRLKALGLVENVTMIPQGALTMDEPATVPVVAKNEGSIVIGCYGFFVKDKGIMQLIEAVAQLRDHYGELRLRLVNAQYDETESAREIARCRTVAETAGLDAVVEWHTDFLPDVESRRLLADCDLVVLPYQVSKEGSSAALRMAMSAGSPVAVTPLPLFDEAGAAAFRFASPDSAAIAQGIAFLLDRPKQRQAMQAEMRLWMADRAWPVIAERFQGMLRGLRVNWRMPHAGCPSVGAGTLPTVLAPVDTTV